MYVFILCPFYRWERVMWGGGFLPGSSPSSSNLISVSALSFICWRLHLAIRTSFAHVGHRSEGPVQCRRNSTQPTPMRSGRINISAPSLCVGQSGWTTSSCCPNGELFSRASPAHFPALLQVFPGMTTQLNCICTMFMLSHKQRKGKWATLFVGSPYAMTEALYLS